jgi:hypothetical protein
LVSPASKDFIAGVFDLAEEVCDEEFEVIIGKGCK